MKLFKLFLNLTDRSQLKGGEPSDVFPGKPKRRQRRDCRTNNM